MTRSDLISAAIALGAYVFPCAANKHPLTKRGLYDASNDPETIRKLFSHPDAALIGLPTGPKNGIVVIDLDTKGGRDGTLWAKTHNHELPRTRLHRTPSGGWHMIFRAPDAKIANSANRLAPGVDVRGTGGYVIVPPFGGYTVARNCPPLDMPEWLIKACTKRDDAPAQTSKFVERIKTSLQRSTELADQRLFKAYSTVANAAEGGRNDILNRETFIMAGIAKAGFLSLSEVEQMMLAAGHAAGLPTSEVELTVRSAMRAAS